MTELAGISRDGKRKHERAARELIAKVARKTARAVGRKKMARK